MRPWKKRETRKMLETRTESETRVGWSKDYIKSSHKLGKGMITDDSIFEADRLSDAASSMWKKCSINHYRLLVHSPSLMATAAISRPVENGLNMAHLYQVSVFSHVRRYLCTLHRFGFLRKLLSLPFPSSSISPTTAFFIKHSALQAHKSLQCPLKLPPTSILSMGQASSSS